MGGSNARRVSAIPVTAIVIATFLAAASAMPAAAVSPTSCRVRNLDSGLMRLSLQKAVDRAGPGDHLTLRGTCHGTATLGKNLHLIGVQRGSSGRPTLDGDDKGTVVTVAAGVEVNIRDLRIRDGDPNVGRPGGGMYNEGTVTLLGDTAIQGCVDTGVLNEGTLRLHGSSSIRDNRGGHSGGGVYNPGTLVLLGSSSISGNSAGDSSGGVWNLGTLKLKDFSSISGNTANLVGGGVVNTGSMTMSDSSSVRFNGSDGDGGGVFSAGYFVMDGSSTIKRNHSGANGGGIAMQSGASNAVGVVCGGNVHHNSPDDCLP